MPFNPGMCAVVEGLSSFGMIWFPTDRNLDNVPTSWFDQNVFQFRVYTISGSFLAFDDYRALYTRSFLEL